MTNNWVAACRSGDGQNASGPALKQLDPDVRLAPHQITSIWDAVLVSRVGNRYTLGTPPGTAPSPRAPCNLQFNATPGGTVTALNVTHEIGTFAQKHLVRAITTRVGSLFWTNCKPPGYRDSLPRFPLHHCTPRTTCHRVLWFRACQRTPVLEFGVMYLQKPDRPRLQVVCGQDDVELQRGTTAIVGPNGCGSRTSPDAIRWVGGGAIRQGLRGGEMADVISTGRTIGSHRHGGGQPDHRGWDTAHLKAAGLRSSSTK